MSMGLLRVCGDYRTTYSSDSRMFSDRYSFYIIVIGILLLLLSPFFLDQYLLSILIQIGFLGIAALGLNVLVGFTGQISIGHAAFFGFGAFASVWINSSGIIPVWASIPLAGLMTASVGLIFGIPAARIKGLYLAIATLAAQFILEDFFARADWFTGGVVGAMAEPFTLFGFYFI